jgi:hypothetical protein
MREEGGLRFYSASDLVNYLGCAHATFCDLRQLAQPVELSEDDKYAALLQEKGFEHERAYLERLRKTDVRSPKSHPPACWMPGSMPRARPCRAALT